MILLDGTRYDSIKNLKIFQEWINKGTLFSNTITYGPQTVTALHALFSGIYGNVNGADNYFGSIKFKKKSCKTMAQYLKDIEFKNYADVLQDIILPKQGFDEVTLHDEHRDDIIIKHSQLIKEKSKLRDKNQNFFLFLQYSSIHTNMIKNVVKKYNYDDFNKEYFSNKEKNLKNYNSYVKKSEDYLKKILKVSGELDLFSDTIFIIFSDHGSSVGEKPGELGYGRYCYDYTVKTFMSFIQPEIFPVIEVKKLSRIIDILPTILEIFKISEDKNFLSIQGKSLFSLMKDEPDDRIAFSEAAGIEQKPTNRIPYIKAVRTKDWKLIYNTDTKLMELYNLKNDSREEKNLAEEAPNKTKEMFDKLINLSPEIKELKNNGKINL